jgi:predicted transcriptional regulator
VLCDKTGGQTRKSVKKFSKRVDKFFTMCYNVKKHSEVLKMAKINISINDDLLQRLDEYADHTYNTRSGTITLALSQLLGADELIRGVSSMSLAMQKIADTGNIDDETMKELEDFQRLANMLVATKK